MKGLMKMRWTKRIEWLPLIAALLMIGIAAMAAKVEKVEFLNDSGAYDGLVYFDRVTTATTINGALRSTTALSGTSGSLDATQAKFQFYYADATNWSGLGANAAGSLWIRTGNSTGYEFWMTNAGQFGFGTANPTAGYKVEIVGAAKITGNASIAGRLYSGKLASAPASPAEGDQFYNSTTHKLQVYDGSTWQNCW